MLRYLPGGSLALADRDTAWRRRRSSRRSCSRPSERGVLASAISGLLAELVVDEPQRRLERAVVEPEDQAQREEVPAAVGFLLCPGPGLRPPAASSLVIGDREAAGTCSRLPSSSGLVVVAGLLQVLLVEGVLVDDQDAARRAGRRGSSSARPGSSPPGRRPCRRACRSRCWQKWIWKPRHAGQRAARGANLGREVGERGDVVARPAPTCS